MSENLQKTYHIYNGYGITYGVDKDTGYLEFIRISDQDDNTLVEFTDEMAEWAEQTIRRIDDTIRAIALEPDEPDYAGPGFTQEELHRLHVISRRATPGPWEWWNGCSWWRIGRGYHDPNNARPILEPTTSPTDGHPDTLCSSEDRAVIIEARNALPRLLQEIYRLQNLVEELEEKLNPDEETL